MSLRGTMTVVAALAGCGEEPVNSEPVDSGLTDDEGLAIAGSYVDQYGTEHDITESSWTQTFGGYPPSVFDIAVHDNVQEWLVAHNDDANPFNPGAWSRFDWVGGGDGHLYYCQTTFDAPDQDSAEQTARPADTDPATSGCGGFPWTDLQP